MTTNTPYLRVIPAELRAYPDIYVRRNNVYRPGKGLVGQIQLLPNSSEPARVDGALVAMGPLLLAGAVGVGFTALAALLLRDLRSTPSVGTDPSFDGRMAREFAVVDSRLRCVEASSERLLALAQQLSGHLDALDVADARAALSTLEWAARAQGSDLRRRVEQAVPGLITASSRMRALLDTAVPPTRVAAIARQYCILSVAEMRAHACLGDYDYGVRRGEDGSAALLGAAHGLNARISEATTPHWYLEHLPDTSLLTVHRILRAIDEKSFEERASDAIGALVARDRGRASGIPYAHWGAPARWREVKAHVHPDASGWAIPGSPKWEQEQRARADLGLADRDLIAYLPTIEAIASMLGTLACGVQELRLLGCGAMRLQELDRVVATGSGPLQLGRPTFVLVDELGNAMPGVREG